MPKRNVDLTDHFDRFVAGQVASGRYQDASEVMRDGLRLLERQARDDEERLTLLRKLASDGFEAIDRGDAVVVEGDEQLANFIAKTGRRAARRVERGRG